MSQKAFYETVSAPLLHEDVRDAVVTIQGGGIYGLTVLGQAQEILETLKFTPLAFAGTSAGAIVATLLWARLSPSQIEQKFIEYAQTHSLLDLLGPFEDPPKESRFDFGDFVDLERSIENFISIPVWKKVFQGFSLRSRIKRHLTTRGIFRGDHLERFIEGCLREAPDLKGRKPLFPGEPLKFRHFRELAKADASFRPPLFIAVTNLTSQQLELVNSVDDEYLNLSIAKVVRASAGVPGFFRPREMAGKTEHDCYVDGGVVSNFPAWVFTKVFRKKIQESKYFQWFSSKAWVHIGLRVGGDPQALPDLRDPREFVKALLKMMTGNARNELESLLSDMVPRSIIVRQPASEADAPTGFLDIDALDVGKIRGMVASGREFAKARFKDFPKSIVRFSKKQEVEKQLVKLVERCGVILNSAEPSASKLRANVYIAMRSELRRTFDYGTDSADPDKALDLGFTSGLTGRCYTLRVPGICNLEKIRKLAESGEIHPDQLFGMTLKEHLSVRKDRTWLASMPIFDPYDVSLERSKAEARALSRAPHSHTIFSPLDGGVIGTLNLDGAIDYTRLKIDDDPGKHAYDPRIEAMLDTMQSTAIRIGVLLAEKFDS